MKLKYIFIILFFLIFNSGCDRDLEIERHLKNELQILKKRVRSQNTKINKLQTINSDLKARIAELSSKQKGGLLLEEKRRALIEKEANLKTLESELLERKSHILELENYLKEQENELTIKTEQFINNKQNLLKTIGESSQIKADYTNTQTTLKQLRADRNRAENKANNWFIWFSIIGLILFISVATLYFLITKLKERNIEVNAAYNIMKLSSNERKKLFRMMDKNILSEE